MSNFEKKPVLDRVDKPVLDRVDKPDFRELDLAPPDSPTRTRLSGPTVSTSSSSSGSFSGRFSTNPAVKGHSGELLLGSGRVKTGHRLSGSTGSLSVGDSVNSPASPVNVLPTGNIISPSSRIKSGQPRYEAAQPAARKPDVLGSGRVNYGHGSIIRAGGAAPKAASTREISGVAAVGTGKGNVDPEELKRVGNEEYKRGNFGEALCFYDKAIAIAPGNATYRSNRAAALTGLGRVMEAVRECEEAVRLDPAYDRAHHRLGSLLIRLGQVEVARKHLFYARQQPDATELHKLQVVEKHLFRCFDARKHGDWKITLREVDNAITAGADYSPQLLLCKAESLLKLQQIDDVENILLNIPKLDQFPNCCSHSKFFGMLSEAYVFFVRGQIEMAFGRFENAVTLVEKAGKIDPRSVEVAKLLNIVRLVARARARGNDLFKSERFTEACTAYGEGLKHDPSNSVLYGNRAACWYKLAMWEKSIEDCDHALRIHPTYNKALLRRAASNKKLERWDEAIRDYEVLRKELPHDKEVAESLFHVQAALKKSRGEEALNVKLGGDVEEITDVEHFRTSMSLSDDVEESPDVAMLKESGSHQHSKYLRTVAGRRRS